MHPDPLDCCQHLALDLAPDSLAKTVCDMLPWVQLREQEEEVDGLVASVHKRLQVEDGPVALVEEMRLALGIQIVLDLLHLLLVD